MIRWIPYAFVRIVFFFILGICIGIFYPNLIPLPDTQVLFLLFTLFYWITAIFARRGNNLFSTSNTKVYAGLIGLGAILVGGYLNVVSHTDSRKSDHIIHLATPIEFYKAVVTNSPQEKDRSWKFQAAITAVRTEGQWTEHHGKVLLYLMKEGVKPPTQYGDVLLIKGQPQLVPGPGNPEEFDYRKFLSFKNIFHQQFVREDQVKCIDHTQPHWVEYYALQCRRWAEERIKNRVAGRRERAVAMALVLGVTGGLDDDLLSAYKATGAMHVLAVSGLHVGIIYALLLFLLKPLKKLPYGQWVTAGICLMALWGYAFITGLSPSVLRAVTMFSFLAIAKPGGHRTNIYNTLAASSFCILLYDPFLLMSVGFQLSYLAVLGIVYMQPRIYNLWEPTSRLLNEVWKISSVAIAAQLGTFAIGLLYFHQFPNYFLLSNLFVIPGSFAILILGIGTLAFDFLQPVAYLFGILLEWTIKAVNFIVFTLEQFPFSLIENVYLNIFQCCLLIGIVLVLLLLLETRKFSWVIAVSFLCVVFSISRWQYFRQTINVQKLTIYNVRGHTAIDLMDDGRTSFMADSALLADDNKIGFQITPNRIKAGVMEKVSLGVEAKQNLVGCSLIVWKGKSFLWICKKDFVVPPAAKVDYVIISNNAVENLATLAARIKADQFIWDSSNSLSATTSLLKEGKNFPQRIYSVLHQGAFELYL